MMTSSAGFEQQRSARSMPSLPPTVTMIWLRRSRSCRSEAAVQIGGDLPAQLRTGPALEVYLVRPFSRE